MSMYPGLSDEARSWWGLPSRLWESSFFDVAREVYGTGRGSESVEEWEARGEIRRARMFGGAPSREAVAIVAAAEAAKPVSEADLWEARGEIRRCRIFGGMPRAEALALVARARAQEQARALPAPREAPGRASRVNASAEASYRRRGWPR